MSDDTVSEEANQNAERAKPAGNPQTRRGVPPWEGPWPAGDHFDDELLAEGDYRNVEDQYRYWKQAAIREEIARQSLGYEVAIENLGHDFNIGSIVRTANALGASRVHIVGRRRWNRRGAMVTDRYLDVVHHETVESFATDCSARGLVLAGIDNVDGSVPLEENPLPQNAVLVFGEEAAGLSAAMRDECQEIFHITQHGSTRSMNVGHAAAIAMWAWVTKWQGE